jgi:hypothetical protein
MKRNTNPVLVVFAIIGICALLYGAWQFYARREAEERSRTMFAAPAPPGLPDIFHNAPPPKQP